MQGKAWCVGVSQAVGRALSGGGDFATSVLVLVVGNALGVEKPLERPAEYQIMHAEIGSTAKGSIAGVCVRLTGVSRNGRTTKQIHVALRELERITVETLAVVLDADQGCQVQCVIGLDGEIETAPESGQYSAVIESEAVWVQGTEGRC